jgi:hypothetical protein
MGGGQPLPEGADKPVDRRTVRRVAGFFAPYRGKVLLTVGAILIVAVLGLANPLLLKLLIDEAIPERDLDRLFLFVGLMIGLPILTGLIGIGQSYLNTAIGRSVMRDLATPSTPTSSGCPSASSPRPGPARSRPASPATSPGSSRSSPTRRPASSATWPRRSRRSSRCG